MWNAGPAKVRGVGFRSERRVPVVLEIAINSLEKSFGFEVGNIKDEAIRMLCVNAEWLQYLRRKIPVIEGYDDARAGGNGCRQHVPVVLVWKLDRWNEMLVGRHQSIRNC